VVLPGFLDVFGRKARTETAEESGDATSLTNIGVQGKRHSPPVEFDRRNRGLGGSSNAATGFRHVHYSRA